MSDPAAYMYGNGLNQDPHAAKRARVDVQPDQLFPESEIMRLVAEREQHRLARRFQESDAIRDELRAAGVEIYDKEKEWKAKDGRRGKMFTAASECPLIDCEIVERISEREEARKNKDFSRADSIRDDLRMLGVELHDKDSTWTTAAGRSGTYLGQVHSQTSVIEIRALVSARERHRAAQDYQAADEVRRQLSSIGVEVFDNERCWRASNGLQGVIISGGHDVDCRINDVTIALQVQRREDARSQKDFHGADRIRNELRSQGVELIDSEKRWITTDGRSGNYTQSHQTAQAATTPAAHGYAHYSAAPRQMTGAAAGAGGGAAHAAVLHAAAGSVGPMRLSDASIAALVEARERARQQHNWQASDAIRQDLRSHGVEVLDKEKFWRATDGRSGRI